jgi:hypothetical protein
MIPPPPAELQGTELQVEYLSVMAQAQKRLGLSNLQEFVGSACRTSPPSTRRARQGRPRSARRRVRRGARRPADLIVPDEQVQQIRAARAKAAQAQQSAELAAKVAPAMNQLASASATNPDLLSQIIEASRQAGAVPGEAAA